MEISPSGEVLCCHTALTDTLALHHCHYYCHSVTVTFALCHSTTVAVYLQSVQVMCFGDTGSVVHLWADRPGYSVHRNPRECHLPSRHPPPPSFEMSASMPFTYGGNIMQSATPSDLASSWCPSSKAARKCYRHGPFRLRHEWKHAMQNRGAVWHMTNSLKLKPNTQAMAAILRTPSKPDTPNHFRRRNSLEEEDTMQDIEGNTSVPDSVYRKVEQKLPEMTPGAKKYFGEFDFQQFNSTMFGGLENGLPNDYANPWIQVLYFLSPARMCMMAHDCDKQHSLTSELGFLFRMLDMSKGLTCHGSNFLRALRHNPTAEQLCLLDTVSGQKVSTNVPYPQRAERFCDFFLSQLHKEGIDSHEKSGSADDSWVSKHFGCQIVSHMRCEGCLSSKEQPSNTTSFDMKYDEASIGTTFHQIVVQTLCKSRRFRMQCSECKRSNLFKSSSVLTLIPPALVFKCDLSGADDGALLPIMLATVSKCVCQKQHQD